MYNVTALPVARHRAQVFSRTQISAMNRDALCVLACLGALASRTAANASIRTSDGNVIVTGADLLFSQPNASSPPISITERKEGSRA